MLQRQLEVHEQESSVVLRPPFSLQRLAPDLQGWALADQPCLHINLSLHMWSLTLDGFQQTRVSLSAHFHNIHLTAAFQCANLIANDTCNPTCRHCHRHKQSSRHIEKCVSNVLVIGSLIDEFQRIIFLGTLNTGCIRRTLHLEKPCARPSVHGKLGRFCPP